MPRSSIPRRKPIEQYDHQDKTRSNNPPAGLIDAQNNPDKGEKKTYHYDPHLDPTLQWAGKAEHTSFDIDTVSLHVHERIDPKTILGSASKGDRDMAPQGGLFAERKPLREAIDFYKHKEGWSNRLIAGDSLLVMNSLLEKEGMHEKVQMIYIDPPYGINYGSNFQPFVGKRDVKDGKAEDLTGEPEQIKAFRDTWQLGIHSYLSYLRDRLKLAHQLLTNSGSCFVQISDENVHLVRNLMDEIFGPENFVAQIAFRTKNMPLNSKHLEQMCDFAIWYAKDKEQVKYNKLYIDKDVQGDTIWKYIGFPDGTYRKMTTQEVNRHALCKQDFDKGGRIFRSIYMEPSGINESGIYEIEFEGKRYSPNKSWKYDKDTMQALIKEKLLFSEGESICGRYYLDFFPVTSLTIPWTDTNLGPGKKYVVQTANKVIERCMLMTTDPGDVVLDPTCGSGTTAFVAEQWGRRWITCDTSRVALTIARQRLMTAYFDYYQLANPDEGVGSGFVYKKVPHVTLKSIAHNEPAAEETLYDQPFRDSKKHRIAGPFTYEAVPAPYTKNPAEVLAQEKVRAEAVEDVSVARRGETHRLNSWCDELRRTGVRAKDGKRIMFSRIEILEGTKHLQALGETDEAQPRRTLIVFGPEYGPLSPGQVDGAMQKAREQMPKPDILMFSAFQFDPEAAKDIDQTSWPGMTLLKVDMNDDLLTEDLRKGGRSNESFWLVGSPDVRLHREGEAYRVEVLGFDYYDVKAHQVQSGDADKIAVWMLDTNYDGRSVFPHQVFFPMAGGKEGFGKLAKNLRAEMDETKMEAFHGNRSLPFSKGDTGKVAVKIVDDRGIESLKVLNI